MIAAFDIFAIIIIKGCCRLAYGNAASGCRSHRRGSAGRDRAADDREP
jgi:hypothetical protein